MTDERIEQLCADIQEYLREEAEKKAAQEQLQNEITEDLSDQNNSTDWVSIILKATGLALTALSVGYVYLVWYAIKYLDSWVSTLAVGTFALFTVAIASGITFQIKRLRLLNGIEKNLKALLMQKIQAKELLEEFVRQMKK